MKVYKVSERINPTSSAIYLRVGVKPPKGYQEIGTLPAMSVKEGLTQEWVLLMRGFTTSPDPKAWDVWGKKFCSSITVKVVKYTPAGYKRLGSITAPHAVNALEETNAIILSLNRG